MSPGAASRPARHEASRKGFTTRALLLVAGWVGTACSGGDVPLFRIGDASAGPSGGGGTAASTGGTPSASGGFPGSGGVKPTAGGRSGAGGHPPTGGTPAAGGTSASGGATSAGGSGGGAADSGPVTNCVASSDCPQTWTCFKADCAAASGVCEPRPAICDATSAPVCGCDHITYLNDCVRRQAGVPGGTAGECGAGGVPCATAVDCRTFGASCSHVLPAGSPCTLALGTCWVTPLDCTNAPPSPRWTLCSSGPIGPSPLSCVDTCTAVRSGLPYVPATPGILCQ